MTTESSHIILNPDILVDLFNAAFDIGTCGNNCRTISQTTVSIIHLSWQTDAVL